MSHRSTGGPTTIARAIGQWVGVLLMLAVGYIYLVSGLVAPVWAVTGLLVVWTVAFIFGLREWKSRPLLILAAPFLLMVFWAVVIWAGGTFLDWSA